MTARSMALSYGAMTFAPPPLPPDVANPEGERETLQGFLDHYRVVIVRKVAGLSLEDATRRVVASDSTLLGIVKHLGYVERGWFQSGIGGQVFEVPWTDEDPDADFRIEPGETVESVVAWYQEQCERAREIVANTSLDRLEVRVRSAPQRSLRCILVHMIEETARHAGHMDIIREQIDGVTGD
jgi:uncharacterized damage-inducible protein DinB